MPNPKPPYAAQFRERVVELVQTAPKPGELAKEFGYQATSILSWVRMAGVAHGSTPTQSAALSADERHELMELRRKLRQVQMERDILAKANAALMRHGHMRGVSRRRSFCVTTEREARHRSAPDLVNREFVATDINQLWLADMTYIPAGSDCVLGDGHRCVKPQGGGLCLWRAHNR